VVALADATPHRYYDREVGFGQTSGNQTSQALIGRWRGLPHPPKAREPTATVWAVALKIRNQAIYFCPMNLENA
jgi:hypothetical protein